MAIYEQMTVKGRGGALPTYSRQVRNHVPGQGISARVSDGAVRTIAASEQEKGRSLQALAGAVNRTVQAGLRAYDDYSKSKATQLITEYRRGMNEKLYGDYGILTRKGEEAFNADADRGREAENLRGTLLKDANKYTRYYFNRQADEYDADTSLKAQRYAREQKTEVFNRNDQAAAEERAESAIAGYANEEDFNRNTGESLWYAEQLLRRKGYSGEALERGLKETASKIFMGGIKQALGADDVKSAERLLAQGGRPGDGKDRTPARMTATDLAKAGDLIRDRKEVLRNRAEIAARRAEAERERAERQAEKEVKKAAEEQERRLLEETTASVLEGLKDMPDGSTLTEKQAQMAQLTAGLDPALRAKVRKTVENSLQEEELQRKAGVALDLLDLHTAMRQNPGLTISQRLAYINEAAVSDEARARAAKEIEDAVEGKDNAENSAAGAAVLRAAWDAGSFAGKGELQAAALDLGLNSSDMADVLNYPGKDRIYSQYRIDGLINSVMGKDTDDKTRGLIYQALMKDPQINAGQQLEDRALKEKIYNLAAEGRLAGKTSWYHSKSSMAGAVADDQGEYFRPDIPGAIDRNIEQRLAENPAYREASAEARKLMRQAEYMTKTLGRPVKFTTEEKRLLRGVRP